MGGRRGRLISLSDREIAIKLIDEARINGARLEPACRVLGITSRTYQRWVKGGKINADQRPHTIRPRPKNKLSEDEKDEILKVANSKEYASLPPTQIVPKLADKGKYIASESSFYRVLKEHKMLNHRGRSKPSKSRPLSTHIAKKPNEVWTWDITWLHRDVKGLYYKLYMIVDIFSRKIVGYEVWEEENSRHSETLVKKALFSENICGRPIVLHSDNGAPMKGATFLATLERLGVQSSFSRPRVSNDNPYSESLFKTLKYIPSYPEDGFISLDHAREWVKEFVYWYNNIHYHSGINYITPNDRHNGSGEKIMEKRIQVYKEAKKLNPARWSKTIRDWSLPETVALNPTKEAEHALALACSE